MATNFGFYNQPLHQGLYLVTPPASEPVTVAEAKAFARVEIDDDDTLFASLITAARSYAEVVQKRQIISATYQLVLDQFPVYSPGSMSYVGPTISLPMPKLSSVTSIVYQGITLDPSNYIVDTKSQPARIAPAYSMTWPQVRAIAGAVVVTYVTGYANAAAVPEATKTAIKLLVNHWYRNREALGNVGGPMDLAVETLLAIDSIGSYS